MGLLQRRSARQPDGSELFESGLAEVRAELERVRAELTRVQGAFDSLPMGVVLVDASGEMRTRNAAAQRLGGVAHGDVLVLEAVDKHVEQALRGKESQSSVQLYGPPLRVINVRAVPLREGGALVSVEDISERARLDAVRTDFVANISHELKTPIGALAVLAETMVDEDDLDTVHRLAEKTMNEALRAATSIDDLLELSRIELGGRAVRDPVAVPGVLRAAIERTASSAEQRRVSVSLDIVELDLVVLGDRRQLVSALANLVDNAIKYSETGAAVHVSAERDGDHVACIVRDHGIGIPAKDLDRIFERFYRVDRARSRDTGGTGLGLAIVRHVANNHEGEVRVQSTEGEGSTFTVRIPAAPR
jgi:two-component system sensor histidine kinase SenX3